MRVRKTTHIYNRIYDKSIQNRFLKATIRSRQITHLKNGEKAWVYFIKQDVHMKIIFAT